jgi:hypothetical protein
MSGVRYPTLTTSQTYSYKAKVLAADDNWGIDSGRVPEYEMSSGRIFSAWYKSRSPYDHEPVE